jgi:hypothetical protein
MTFRNYGIHLPSCFRKGFTAAKFFNAWPFMLYPNIAIKNSKSQIWLFLSVTMRIYLGDESLYAVNEMQKGSDV